MTTGVPSDQCHTVQLHVVTFAMCLVDVLSLVCSAQRANSCLVFVKSYGPGNQPSTFVTSPRCTGFPSDNVVACLAYQSLSGQAPQYLPADIQLISDSGCRQLRSASDRRCIVPPCRIHSATEVFASPDHACGTDFLGVYEARTSATDNSDSS